MYRDELIRTAEEILSQIKHGDIFGIGSTVEYLEAPILPKALKWAEQVHDFGLLSNNPLGGELSELRLINHNRLVSRARIERAITILRQL